MSWVGCPCWLVVLSVRVDMIVDGQLCFVGLCFESPRHEIYPVALGTE